ncbi:MAG: TetR/AcrR family transcriptional regulator [Candidatus Cloacimonadia bacterium]
MKPNKRLPQEQRRQQIIQKAMELINDEGFAAFTTRRLAKKVGISEPALYRHFENKDDIIINVILELDKFWLRVERELYDIQEPKERVCHFIMSHFKHLSQNPNGTAILFAEEYIRLEENIQSRVSNVITKRYIYLRRLIGELLADKIICGENEEAIALIIMGSIRMTVQNWRNANYSYSLTRYGEDICCNLVNMLFR